MWIVIKIALNYLGSTASRERKREMRERERGDIERKRTIKFATFNQHNGVTTYKSLN